MSDGAYRILGVSSDASDAQIKRNYRRLARQYHPDRNPNDEAAEERFKSIQTAYEQVGSMEARAEYDQKIRMQEMFQGGRGNSFSGGFGGFDIGDIFSQFRGHGQNNRSKQAQETNSQSENIKTLYITSVSGPKQYKLDREQIKNYESDGYNNDKFGEQTQFFQVINIEDEKLIYSAYTTLGTLYDRAIITKDFATGKKTISNQ